MRESEFIRFIVVFGVIGLSVVRLLRTIKALFGSSIGGSNSQPLIAFIVARAI
jgi:hypothetical protein